MDEPIYFLISFLFLSYFFFAWRKRVASSLSIPNTTGTKRIIESNTRRESTIKLTVGQNVWPFESNRLSTYYLIKKVCKRCYGITVPE